MEIRRLNNSDFLALCSLQVEFYETLPVPADAFVAIDTLTTDAKCKFDFRAWGLFENDLLVGFVTGYANTKKSFYFSGLYVIIRLNRNLKKFIDFCFNEVETDGYTSWEVDCTNSNITSMMEKYGAAPIYTRYTKTLGV